MDYYPVVDSVGNRFPTLCPAGKDCTYQRRCSEMRQ